MLLGQRVTFLVPRITNTMQSVARLLEKIETTSGLRRGRVTFDFSSCPFIHAPALTVLGGWARVLEHRGVTVVFKWDSCVPSLLIGLQQSGFAAAFGGPLGPPAANPSDEGAIPYREQVLFNVEEIVSYLSSQWLGRGWIAVSEQLKEMIVGRVCEIYTNAFDHGHSPVGVIACGRYIPADQRLSLVVADFGIGIPENVRTFLGNPRMGDQETLRWAFTSGTTTRPTNVPRGLGLDLLKTFVRLNGGRLRLWSGRGYALVNKEGEEFHLRDAIFPGTLVSINLVCDHRRYVLASEAKRPVFSK